MQRYKKIIEKSSSDEKNMPKISSQSPLFGILPSRPHFTLTRPMADEQGHREGVRVVRVKNKHWCSSSPTSWRCSVAHVHFLCWVARTFHQWFRVIQVSDVIIYIKN